MRDRKLATILLAGALASSLLAAGTAHAASCAPASDGGDWNNFGNDLGNTRNQPDEHLIGPSNVTGLKPRWILSTSQMGAGVSGAFHNTPIVTGGCLYIGTNAGWVVKLNADTGGTVWKRGALDGSSSLLVGEWITGSVAVGRGEVYAGVARNVDVANGKGPYVQQIHDDATGSLGWKTVVDQTPSAFLVAGPQLFYADDVKDGNGNPVYPKGLIFQGFSGGESQGIVSASVTGARGGYAILDAATGDLLKKGYAITDAEYANGYRGASIWGTAAIDQDNLFAYVPTGNPASGKKEAAMSNSILKVDVNPAHTETFGKIVSFYKGLPDNYVAATDLYQTAACQTAGNTYAVIWSQTCGQMDLDFGGAPSLFTLADGTPVVGDLQKAGVYHAIRRSDMTKAWTTIVGTPEFFGNSNSGAVDGDRVYTAGQEPSEVYGLARNDGLYNWTAPLPDGPHYQAVSVANGVVYTADGTGTLHAFDAALGVPLGAWNVSVDSGQSAADTGNSTGIAIARHTIYYPDGNGFLAAYALP